jgi:hypothetical protein
VSDDPPRPSPPDLPAYLLDPLARQSPERLDAAAAYARDLADWKRERRRHEARRRRSETAADADDLAALERRGVSTDPTDYDDLPANAYVTVKTTKRTGDRAYRYYYWQWRDGDSWENAYIAPVEPRA